MRVGKRPSKKSLKKLHGALKDMLKRESLKASPEINDHPTIPDITEAVKYEPTVGNQTQCKAHKELQDPPAEERNGVMYIMSKENQLIPKLTDDQVMKLHKKADENMKRVWSEIISKYETMEDQGDVIDMQTGELIEDNGHIRGISQGTSEVRYHSTLRDLIDVEESDDELAIWQDEGEEEDEDYEGEEEFSKSNDQSEEGDESDESE